MATGGRPHGCWRAARSGVARSAPTRPDARDLRTGACHHGDGVQGQQPTSDVGAGRRSAAGHRGRRRGLHAQQPGHRGAGGRLPDARRRRRRGPHHRPRPRSTACSWPSARCPSTTPTPTAFTDRAQVAGPDRRHRHPAVPAHHAEHAGLGHRASARSRSSRPSETVAPDSPILRAVSLTVPAERAVGGLIAAGQRVDLIATLPIAVSVPVDPDDRDCRPSIPRPASPSRYAEGSSTKVMWLDVEILVRDPESDRCLHHAHRPADGRGDRPRPEPGRPVHDGPASRRPTRATSTAARTARRPTRS